MRKTLRFGLPLALLVSCGASVAQMRPEKPFELNIYGTRVQPNVMALSEKIPPLEKNRVTLEPNIPWKNRVLLGAKWTSNGANFQAGIKPNKIFLKVDF
jgi:hypothetical protein